MEFYQVIQNRAFQTAAVIQAQIPTLKVAGKGAADLIAAAEALATLAQTRDQALTAYDEAVNAERIGFLAIRTLDLTLPVAAEGELDDSVDAEADLADLLAPAYAVVPRTTELALDRGNKLVAALGPINTYLAAQTPARGPITAGGKGVAQLLAAMAAQPALELAVETTQAAATIARTGLRNPATELDRLNKRFYKKLEAEARTNPALAAALGQIDTDTASLPPTLGIFSLVQGGTDDRQIVVRYETFDAGLINTLEWMVVGVDAEFTHSQPAAPSGNEIGPFADGQVVRLRTRTRSAGGSGTTTGSVRTLKIQAPV